MSFTKIYLVNLGCKSIEVSLKFRWSRVDKIEMMALDFSFLLMKFEIHPEVTKRKKNTNLNDDQSKTYYTIIIKPDPLRQVKRLLQLVNAKILKFLWNISAPYNSSLIQCSLQVVAHTSRRFRKWNRLRVELKQTKFNYRFKTCDAPPNLVIAVYRHKCKTSSIVDKSKHFKGWKSSVTSKVRVSTSFCLFQLQPEPLLFFKKKILSISKYAYYFIKFINSLTCSSNHKFMKASMIRHQHIYVISNLKCCNIS